MDLKKRLISAVLLLLAVTAAATAGYLLLGGSSVRVLDALYMAVITVAGVGYGEIVETAGNPALRIFNMFVVVVGVALTVYVFSVITAFLIGSELSNIFRRRKMQKRISELNQHYIVCAAGDTGRYAAEEMLKTGTPFVMIEMDEEKLRRTREQRTEFKDMLYVVGDATDEAVLEAAGVDRAAGVISTLPHDKDNLVITVMVRQKSPKMRIVARCSDTKFSERMLKAGANSVVSPSRIGGLRLVSEALRPHVVNFLDLMLKEQDHTLRVEEITVPAGSPWAGAPLSRINLRGRFNLLPVALKDESRPFDVNPEDGTLVHEGHVVILIGDVNDIRRARRDAEPSAVASAVASLRS